LPLAAPSCGPSDPAGGGENRDHAVLVRGRAPGYGPIAIALTGTFAVIAAELVRIMAGTVCDLSLG